VLWGREEILQELPAYKVRPAPSSPAAVKWETGTPSFEGQAGTLGALEHIAWAGGGDGVTRANLLDGMKAIAAYENELAAHMLDGLRAIPGLKLWGPHGLDGRVPTFAFTLANLHPRQVAERLAAENIFVWSGGFYAIEVLARLGLENSGGLVRVGLCHYNTVQEVDRTLAAVDAIARENR